MPKTSNPPAETRRPRVLVLGTGGTIAGSSAATDSQAYLAGVLGVDELLAAVPGLGKRAELLVDEVFSIDSVDLTLADRLTVARRLHATVCSAAQTGAPLDGVVVTHGTDTLQDTGFVLHQLFGPADLGDIPVVLTGAMRPADAPGADGPANLADAVTVAAHPTTRGWGVLAVFGGLVFSGRDIVKRAAGGVRPFEGDWGPLGEVSGDAVHLFSRPARPAGEFADVLHLGLSSATPASTPHGTEAPHLHPEIATAPTDHSAAAPSTSADLPGTTSVTAPAAEAPPLPRVEVLQLYPEMAPALLRALASDAPDGLVLMGPGNGNIPASLHEPLAAVRACGTVIVRTTSAGTGVVFRDGATDDTGPGHVAAGDLTPGQARALLTLALRRTRDPEAIQGLFDRL